MSNEEPTRLTFKTGNTWLVAGASLFLLVGLWGTWAWVKWGGEKDAPRDPTEQLVYFGFALLATVIIVPGVLLHIGKIRALVERGVTTRGIVEKVSALGKHGMSPTTVVYTVDGCEYRIRRDLVRSRVAVGGTVTILYDPQNPKRFSIMY